MCDAIYIGNTQKTLKKNEWSFLQSTLSAQEQTKSDSFAAHFVHHFNTTTSRTDLRKYMEFRVVKQLNLIGAMKTFTKTYCNLCMQERLSILKKLRDKQVTVMNKNLEIYGACHRKTTFHRFCLSTDDPIFNG